MNPLPKNDLGEYITPRADNNGAQKVITGTRNYETVAASQTAQIMGATGAANDELDGLLVVPATVSPGAISIKDGASGTSITVFTGGTNSVGSLIPFYVPLGLKATNDWRVTTGANVSLIAVGKFT